MKLAVIVLVAMAAVADARPGGGHSYSSSSSSRSYSSSSSYRSSSGGGSGGDPGAGVAILVIAFLVFVGAIAFAKGEQNSWDSQVPAPLRSRGPDPDVIFATDPDFSLSVFEDFAYELYAAAHRAADSSATLVQLAPYLSDYAAAALKSHHTLPVRQVVVGSLTVQGIDTTREPPLGADASAPVVARHRIAVRFEANLADSNGTRLAVEHWVFTRDVGVKSSAPTKTHAFPCPNCGAPWQAKQDPRTCTHCGERIVQGRNQWAVEKIWFESLTWQGTTLTGTVEEVGTHDPTRTDPSALARWQELCTEDGALTLADFEARLRLVYDKLNEAWNAQQLAPIRGLVTRRMLDYLRYWIEEYQRQQLANRLESAKVTGTLFAKVRRDRYFDAVTVRVWGTGVDYTIDRNGNVVGGSKTSQRVYSEYWTFLRSSTRRGKATTSPNCPSCGAPLAISDAGACTHCNAEVEAGAFDWVLSKIEQDEAYRG